jgi:hypothetical protein
MTNKLRRFEFFDGKCIMLFTNNTLKSTPKPCGYKGLWL